MKKIGIVLAIIAAFCLFGCVSPGNKAGAGNAAPPYIVDLSKMTLYSVTNNPDKLDKPIGNFVKNQEPMTRNWEDLMLVFPSDLPDLTGYSRLTVQVQHYNAANEPIPDADSLSMASMIYDTNLDWRADSGGNTIFKEFNIGGFSGLLHKPRGIRINMSKNPGALLCQKNAGSPTAYIEVKAIVFHNDRYEPK